MNIEDIGRIEFHDAKIGQLLFSCDGKLEIEFRHICLYQGNSLDEDVNDVWSAKANLLLSGVTFVEVVGSIRDDDYVSVGQFIDQDNRSYRMVDRVSTSSAKSCEFLLAGSGTTIKVSFVGAIWSEVVCLERIK